MAEDLLEALLVSLKRHLPDPDEEHPADTEEET